MPIVLSPACLHVLQGLWALIWKAQILDLIATLPFVRITKDFVAGGFLYLFSFFTWCVHVCICMFMGYRGGSHACGGPRLISGILSHSPTLFTKAGSLNQTQS